MPGGDGAKLNHPLKKPHPSEEYYLDYELITL